MGRQVRAKPDSTTDKPKYKRAKKSSRKKPEVHRGIVKDIGHWTNNSGEPIDTRNFGFTYLIRSKQTGKRYIGKKQFQNYSRGKISRESTWRDYTGSNKQLNRDIEVYGKGMFEFSITGQFKTKSMLGYQEANQQHKADCLLDTVRWYNRQIDACRAPPAKEYKK